MFSQVRNNYLTLLYICVVSFILFIVIFSPSPVNAQNGLKIFNITDNRGSYVNSQIPKYEKFEISFQITTSAAPFNYQIPYDPMPTPIPGLTAKQGVSVDAIFTSPSGQIHKQPAFYFQGMDDQIKSGAEWFYPNGSNSWKVRFAPNEVGTWQYQLTKTDVDGLYIEPTTHTFSVTTSSSHGFVKVSTKDSRYFEFDDGTYFPGMGYNMNYNHVDWVNPVLNNQTNFQTMSQNGIQLTRIWLSQWSIYGASWNPWYYVREFDQYEASYIPRSGLITYNAADQPSSTMSLSYAESGSTQDTSWFDAAMATYHFHSPPAVRRGATYHVKVRYKASDISGPRNNTYPNYGFVIKVQNPNDGNWHRTPFNGGDPQNGVRLKLNGTPAYGGNSSTWTYLEADWTNSLNFDFFPILYLALENVNNTNPATGNHAYVHIDTVEIRENLGNGNIGENIALAPSMEHWKYFRQRDSYAFDKALDLAHQNGVYFKPVIMEKNEHTTNEINYQGLKDSSGADNNFFYGNWRYETAVSWYQKAWYRYLQARWGYSPNILAWEVVNEADPGNGNHWAQTDEMGKYLHCTVFGISVPFGDSQKCTYSHPNKHLITTSHWGGFWKTEFWGNSKYPNVDIADIHQYISKNDNPTHYFDTALATYDLSQELKFSKLDPNIKPIIRGETGLTISGTEPESSEPLKDTSGVWLHNYIWGQINAGGLIESYWYENSHIYTDTFDHRKLFKHYYDFIRDIPLNNGKYQDAAAVASDTNVRVWGQKDNVGQTANHAHIWIQNTKHIWCAVVGGISGCPKTWDNSQLSGNITLSGFTPNKSFSAQWWNFNNNVALTKTNSTVNSNANGQIVIDLTYERNTSHVLPADTTDTAIKIGDYSITPTPSPTPTPPPVSGDADGNGHVTADDLKFWKVNYPGAKTGPIYGDFNNDAKVNGMDFILWLSNYGK